MPEKTLLEQLVESLRCMPGIGRKSAQRIAHHLLQRDRDAARHLSRIMYEAMDNIGHCQRCRTFTEQTICHLCADDRRDQSTVCVVENPSDVEAIEEANYHGRYFVLLGHLSPLDGIGPDDLGLGDLEKIVEEDEVKEVILATSSTVEGEATAHFISEMVKAKDKRVSRIAHGIPMGGELEYANSLTIAHALEGRKSI